MCSCLLQGSGCSGQSSSFLAVVAPSATGELNSGCNSSSGSVRSTCWLTMGHATGLALFPLAHCLTFVSDLRLVGAEPVAPPKPGPSPTPHFHWQTFQSTLSPHRRDPSSSSDLSVIHAVLSPAGFLSAFKPPAYEDVVHHPGTPPPPYTMAPGHPLTASSECTSCLPAPSCSAHLEGTNVEGVSSHQSALPRQEGEPRAGVSPVHIPPSCRYRRLTGDSGIELCPCPDSSEGEPVKETRASATQPDLEDHSPCALSPESLSQAPPLGLASSYGDIP